MKSVIIFIATSCAIHEVRIDPCPEASSDLPCKVKRGKSATISFDYTPCKCGLNWNCFFFLFTLIPIAFDSATAFGQVYWASPDGDIPFAGMNTNGCDHTSCPLNKDAKQTYVYTLETAKKFPVRVFDIKWKLSNPITQELCCFQTKIRLIK